MRDLSLDELTHVYGGGNTRGDYCNPQPSQKECKQTNHGHEKKSDCYNATSRTNAADPGAWGAFLRREGAPSRPGIGSPFQWPLPGGLAYSIALSISRCCVCMRNVWLTSR